MSTFTEDPTPINIYTNEAVTWTPGNALTLVNYSGSPGVVESIQLNMNYDDYSMLLNVQIDNYPLITCSAPMFFGFAGNPVNSAQVLLIAPGSFNTNILGGINNKNYISASDGQAWGCTKRVFIPFTYSININLTLVSTSTIVNSQLVYRKWPAAFPLYYSVGERRKYWKVIQSPNAVTLSAFETYNMPSISGRGQIEFITHFVYGVAPLVSGDTTCQPITCLEGACTLNIDGNVQTVPSTDMFWGGLNYWQNGKTVANGPDCGLFSWCVPSWGDKFNMQAYKFCYDKTIFFNESFQFGWTYGDSTYSKFGQGVFNSYNIFLISYWTESQ